MPKPDKPPGKPPHPNEPTKLTATLAERLKARDVSSDAELLEDERVALTDRELLVSVR